MCTALRKMYNRLADIFLHLMNYEKLTSKKSSTVLCFDVQVCRA